ncbi:MAG: bacillithiol system redox-active protein YtxJ [Bacteroidia bacterium]
MEFQILDKIEQLNEIDLKSNSKIQAIYKHSTQCGISMMTNRTLNKELKEISVNTLDVYYLDLIRYRDLSNTISVRYDVEHESPQILFIKEGKCIYYASHSDVSLDKAFQAINHMGVN